MKKLLPHILTLLSFVAYGQQDSLTFKTDSTYSFSISNGSLDSTTANFGLNGFFTSQLKTIDPCESVYWPMTWYEQCPDNPMHCRHCGNEIKKGESFCYIVMEVKDKTKYIDWIHIRCALKRIK